MTAPIRTMPDCMMVDRRQDLVGQPWQVTVWRGGNEFAFIADDWPGVCLVIWRYGIREWKHWKKFRGRFPEPISKYPGGYDL